jgi:glycosyltransferase involved in cell wall biosynthesis
MSGSHPLRVALDGRPLSGSTGARGVGAYVAGVAEGLREAGHDTVLLVAPRDPVPPGSEIVRASAPWGSALFWGRLVGPRWLRASGADVWHATFLAPPRVPAGLPWVATIHDLIPLRHPYGFSHRQRIAFSRSLALSARAPRVVAVSEHAARLVVERFGVSSSRIRVVPPPVRPADAPPRDARPLVDPPFLLHMSGFDPLKGVTDLLLPAFARVAAAHPELRLVALGARSPWREAVERAAADLGMSDRVIFPGRVSADDKAALLASARALVVSSREEGFGIPAIEGLAAGLPVAVGPADATREAVGDHGFLAPRPDVDGMAAALSDALAAPGRDAPEAAARRRHAERFRPRAVAERLVEVYSEVIG